MLKAGSWALVLCCCCSYSNAETITVEEQITEIVDVEVIREITEIVPVETTVTRTDQVNPTPTDFSLNGGVTRDGDYIRFDYRGGTASTTIDTSQYTVINSINHQFMANGCNNQIGGSCDDPNGRLDQLTVTFTYGSDSWSNTVQPNNLDGWTNYSFTYTPSQGNWSPYATLQFYGIDPGFWGGWYGPVTTPGTLDINYDMTQIVMEEVTRTITEIVQQEVTRTITKTYEIPDVEIPVIDVAVPDIGTVETIEVAATTIAAPEIVQIEVSNTAGDTVATIEIDVAPVVEEIKQESGGGEVSQAEVQAKVEEALEKKQSGGSLSIQVKDPFDPVQSAVAIAVMSASSNEAINSYQAVSLQLAANPFYQDTGMPGGTTYDNPAQRIFTGASEERWDNMVDSQWQR